MFSGPFELEELAVALTGEAAAAIERAEGGRNSRVYRVTTLGGSRFALKLYPSPDARDRLGAEYESLQFLREAGVTAVPVPVARDPARGAALYTWITGSPVARPERADIGDLVRFLAETHRASSLPAARTLRAASEAVTSSTELRRQLEQRLARLWAVAGERAALGEVLRAVGRELAARPLGEWAELPRERQTLSPSDIGFHNVLRRRTGGLAFLDFEYFGWDDPVKLVSDVLWHPGHRLERGLAVEFRSAAAEIYSADPDFEVRLAAFYPFFGLRWALIVLNEFLPDDRVRRGFAGETGSRLETEERQLAKARDLIERVRACRP